MENQENRCSFKKCPNGHIYESVEKDCPFCGGLEVDDVLQKLPEKIGSSIRKSLENMAMCYLVGPKE